MAARGILLGLCTILLVHGALAKRYNTTGGRQEGKLNVHIICHSHDDAGWLKTVDQYYYGARNDIQVAGVQYILDTVVQSLAANPDRKFAYADMAFFMRWWAQQEEEERELVAGLVESGRLDFVNGGYVQHDEAASHYTAMIDQTTRGHMFLKKAFNKVPRVGWQIDPFGHSSTQAGLLSANVGFDALFFGRADYQDMAYRKGTRVMEMVWRGSGSLPDADIFTGNFVSGNYGPPGTFNWDWGSWTQTPIMDDPRLHGYNVAERVDTFVCACLAIFNVTRGGDIMIHMGSDFWYSNAHAVYKNIDKLIHYVNLDGRVNAFYSTPAEYVDAKHGYNVEWPLKTDDFFPYADAAHAFWTGYFTSRPTSKGYIRHATSYLQAARQLEAFVGINKTGWSTEPLEEAVSLTQHHDAITGTEKQHVANDYHQRLSRGLKEAQQVVLSALGRIIGGEFHPAAHSIDTQPLAEGSQPGAAAGGVALPGMPGGEEEGAAAALREARRRLLQASADSLEAPVELSACDWLNVSACHASVGLTSEGKGLLVAAYNPLGWSRVATIRVPVDAAAGGSWKVQGPEGEAVPSQLLPVSPATLCLQRLLAGAHAVCPASLAALELVFQAELPPTGYSTLLVQAAPASSSVQPKNEPATSSNGESSSGGSTAAAAAVLTPPAPVAGEPGWPAALHGMPQEELPAGTQSAMEHCSSGAGNHVELSNGLVTLKFCCKRGILLSMSSGKTRINLTTSFAWYNSSDGLDSSETRGQASGAYIFRPNGEYAITPGRGQPVSLEIVRGEVVSEARQVFSDWTTLITRLYAGQHYAEFEWTVGPIPYGDRLGREVVLRYATDVDSQDEFWTDANGREMIKRVRDYRPTWDLNVTDPVAGNYYPLTAAMYIQDAERQVALLTERAQGGSSLRSGELEVMLHRRTVKDDWKGVGEPLNETVCGCTGTACNCPGLVARGVHWLMVSPPKEAASQRRHLQQLINDAPLLGFGAVPAHPEAAQPGSAAGAAGTLGLRREFSMNEHGLPRNVHLLTLMDTGDKSLLVRLAHTFQAGEDPTLSRPATVDLNLLLGLFEYQSVTELSLSGNQAKKDAVTRRLRFKAGGVLGQGSKAGAAAASASPTWAGRHAEAAAGSGVESSLDAAADVAHVKVAHTEVAHLRAGADVVDCRSGCRSGPLLVKLGPMEVRTFELIYG